MLRSAKSLYGYKIPAKDGRIGSVHDFYFDDAGWRVRYAVVDTGNWLPGKLGRISAAALGHPNWAERTLPAPLRNQQVADSPSTDRDKPVSRQHETELSKYYRWPAYWGNTGHAPVPGAMPSLHTRSASTKATEDSKDDPHLRSMREVAGYHIKTTGGEVGHVEDFIVEEATNSPEFDALEPVNREYEVRLYDYYGRPKYW